MQIEIPTNLIGPRTPACLALAWLQLRLLAGDQDRTPPVPLERLARLTGKSQASLYRHLRALKDAGLLNWACQDGALQISFPLLPAPAASEARSATHSAPSSEARPCKERSDEAIPLPALAAPAPAGTALVVAIPAFSILSGDSQKQGAASLNTLKDSDLQLTRARGAFSKLNGGAKTRTAPQNSEDSPLEIYRQLTHLTPNRTQRLLLQQRVDDLVRWRLTLEHWLAHRWNPMNLPGMLDLYQRGGAAACRYCSKTSPPAATLEAIHQLRAKYSPVVTRDQPRAAHHPEPEAET